MKRFHRQVLIGTIFYLSGSAVNLLALNYKPTNLTKLFYHQGVLSDTVVCYFDKEPICNYLPGNPSKKQEEVQTTEFFLPLTQLADSQARVMMQKVNHIKRDHYIIQFVEVTKPLKGIKVTIKYNAQKIYCDYATCDSISMQKGLIFSFHHQETLNLLKDNTDSVLRTVRNDLEKKPRIMLDFGHGGSDAGKIGCDMVQEKDITMQVGTKVAALLKKKGYQVHVTRASDIFVELDERTTLANRCEVDLFVSIHSNAGPKSASGIETYWTGRSVLKHVPISPGNDALALFTEKRDKANKQLAHIIHQNVIQKISTQYAVNDRKVKESVAQVLLGTDMPSALVEIGFLSNPLETKYLTNSSYQGLIAQGICSGIEAYCTSCKIA